MLHDGDAAAKSYASRNLLAQPKALDRHVFDARLSGIEIVSQGLCLPIDSSSGCAMIASLDPR
jgi:hypothetical protein